MEVPQILNIFGQCGYSSWTLFGTDHVELPSRSDTTSGNDSQQESQDELTPSRSMREQSNIKLGDVDLLGSWRPNVTLPVRKSRPTDWSKLKHQGREWEVAEFSGGATTQKDPRRFARESTTGRLHPSLDALSRIEDGISQQFGLRNNKTDSIEDEDDFQSYTPRQRRLYESLNPPEDVTSVESSSVGIEILQELDPTEKRRVVKAMFKDFVIELTRGAFFTQLTSNRDYVTLFCQLMENLEALTFDQNSGRRIEFPLTGKTY